MKKERLQELNQLLLNSKPEKEAFDQLSMEDAYALFRLAAMHHKKVTENIAKLKEEQPKQEKSEQEEKEENLHITDFNEAKIKSQENVAKVLLGKANFFYTLSIERMKKLEAFYVAYSKYTNSPFAFCDPNTFDDMTWIFTSEEKLRQVMEKQKENNIELRGVKVENEKFLQFFTSLFYMGIDNVLFDYGTEGMMFKLTRICKKPNFAEMENKAAAVENSALQLTSMYFLQEARKAEDKRQKESLPQLEEEMSKNLVAGRFLVPFIKVDPEAGNDQKNIQIPYLKGRDDSMILPVFTDLMEFAKYNREKKFSAVILTFDKLSGFIGNGVGIVLNPLGCNLFLKKEQLPLLAKRFEK